MEVTDNANTVNIETENENLRYKDVIVKQEINPEENDMEGFPQAVFVDCGMVKVKHEVPDDHDIPMSDFVEVNMTSDDRAIVQDNLAQPISIKEEVHEETCVGVCKKCKTEHPQAQMEADIKVEPCDTSLPSNAIGNRKTNLKSGIKYKCKFCLKLFKITTKKAKKRKNASKAFKQTTDKINCQFCDETFGKKVSFDDHLLKQHQNGLKIDIKQLITSKIHKCKTCSYATTFKMGLERHVRATHDERESQIKCEFCEKTFTKIKLRDDHLLQQHKTKIKNDLKDFITSRIFKCKTCSYESTFKTFLRRHMNTMHDGGNQTKCQYCGKMFAIRKSLEDHMIKQHKEEVQSNPKLIKSRLHNCKICSYITTHKHYLNHHLNTAHTHNSTTLDPQQIKCQFCVKEFLSKCTLDDHYLKKHKEDIGDNIKDFISNKIYTCKSCSYETTRKICLNGHVNKIHNEDKKICQFCDKTFLILESLDNHLLKHHKDYIKHDVESFIKSKIHVCKTCSYETTHKSLLARHIDLVHNNRKIQHVCQFCGKDFVTKSNFDDHLLKWHKEELENGFKGLITSKIHTCDICSYSTVHKSLLNRHINSVHNEQVQEICQFCGKMFASKTSFDDHLLKKHKEEVENGFEDLITSKIHTCPICSYVTPHKFLFNRHIKTVHDEHKSKTLINCEFCFKKFQSQNSLEGHMIKYHKDQVKSDALLNKIHKCNFCAYETIQKNRLNAHIRTIHKGQRSQHNCEFCDKTFVMKKTLDDHMLKQHKTEDLEGLLSSKVYECPICDFKTTLQISLTSHSAYHVDSGSHTQFKCQFCNKSFYNKRILDEHLLKKHKSLIEDNLEDYVRRKLHKCKFCPYESTIKSSFTKHVNSMHNENKSRIPCKFCEKTFSKKQPLHDHLLKIHTNDIKDIKKELISSHIFTCHICGYETIYRNRIQAHFSSHEGDNTDLIDSLMDVEQSMVSEEVEDDATY